MNHAHGFDSFPFSALEDEPDYEEAPLPDGPRAWQRIAKPEPTGEAPNE